MRRRYMWGANVDEPILWDEGGSMNCTGTRLLHTNAQGSVIALADCFGNLSQVNSYDEFGIPAAGNYTPALRQRFQYTGQSWIPELGMYYYKAWIYSPTLGRFMQTDPIGYGDGINWYNYVGGDPVNMTDPTGMCPLCIGFGVGAVLEAAGQIISTGRVDVSLGGLGKLAAAGVVGASGVGIGGQVAKVTASIAARAALNAAAGATLGAAQTVANSKIDGKAITGRDVAKGAALGAAGGSAGSAASDALKGGARVLAEKTGVNIVTRAGQVATPAASSKRDAVVRSASTVAGNVAGNAPSVGDSVMKRACSQSRSGACN